MSHPITVVDIFAGPGGLSEGFSSKLDNEGNPVFKVKLSIEKEESAYSTLLLRAFYRQFSNDDVPLDYYRHLKAELSQDELFVKFPIQAAQAKNEAWLIELKESNRELINLRINRIINGEPNWVLIGGPPCQAYSLAGRSRMQGQDKEKYSNDKRHFLYKEYLQILADNQPSVFVLENVKGLLSSKINGENTFDLILKDLKHPLMRSRIGSDELLSYELFSASRPREKNGDLKPEDFIVHSEEYGIPQSRHRIFIIGVRADNYYKDPMILQKTSQVSIDDVIKDLPKIRSGISKHLDSSESWINLLSEIRNTNWFNNISSELQDKIRKNINNLSNGLDLGKPYTNFHSLSIKHSEWYVDPRFEGLCNHESRKHIPEDLYRYFFASTYANLYGHSPTLAEYPLELLPNHKNVTSAIEDGSMFNDRFRVQVFGKPSTTIVSHISKDGHYYIHYDPLQCRSLTVREAARLQTFPDNYFFEGTKTQQYHQVGNAVPPLLASKIAEIVSNLLI